jgi:hypothetical protein
MLDSFEPNLHSHLNIRALFLSLRDPIPRPPSFFAREIIDHLTLHMFLPPSFPDHKKDLNFFSMDDAIAVGIGNKERKYMGKLPKTDLIKHNLPPIDNSLPFHEANLALILWRIGFHIKVLQELAPMGRPRYLNGRRSCLHRRICAV